MYTVIAAVISVLLASSASAFPSTLELLDDDIILRNMISEPRSEPNTVLTDDMEYLKLKNSLENLSEFLDLQSHDTRINDVPSFALEAVLGQVLSERGMNMKQVDGAISEVTARLKTKKNPRPSRKRSFKRVGMQTRSSPFGRLLQPNMNLEKGGGTLLRYGRSA